MDIKPYGVYVRTDDTGRITAINSDAFLPNLTGWAKIDEGYGDRHHHAQGNYLDGPLYDERGICRYKLADGAVAPRTQEEMDADYVPPAQVVDVSMDDVVEYMTDIDLRLTMMEIGGEF